jgi:hypothetical protein
MTLSPWFGVVGYGANIPNSGETKNKKVRATEKRFSVALGVSRAEGARQAE